MKPNYQAALITHTHDFSTEAGFPVDAVARTEKVQAALYRISEAAQSSEDLNGLYRMIHAIISELMPAQNFYIALFDNSAGLLSFPYYEDEFDGAPPPQKPGRGLTEYVIRLGLPLLATPEVYEQLMLEGQVDPIGSLPVDWLGAPLKTSQKIIGMMAVQTYSSAVRYSQSDQDVFAFVSAQVAMAIERKKAEEALRDSEERYRLLYESAPVGILLISSTGQVLEVNPAALKILGSPSVEATRAINVLTFPPLKEIDFSNQVQQCLETGQAIVAESPYTSKWGKKIYVHYVLNPVLNAHGAVDRIQALIEDITERKRSEEQIQKLNRMLQVISLVDQAVVRASDEQELTQQVCQALIDVGGYDFAWIGLTASKGDQKLVPMASAWGDTEGIVEPLIFGKDSEPIYEPARRALQTSQPALSRFTPAELRYYPYRQMDFESISVIALPLLSKEEVFGSAQVFTKRSEAFNDDEVKLLVDMANDLAYGILGLRERARRKQAEETLHLTEEKFAKIFHTSPDAITLNRLSDGLFIDINNGFTVISGYNREEVIGKTSKEIQIWADPADRAALVKALQVPGEVQNIETLFRIKGGRLITGLMSARIVQIGDETCLLTITRDISERKLSELERNQRLAELEGINRVSTILRTAQTLDEMLPRLLDETLSMLSAEVGSIWLFEPASGVLHLSVSRGWLGRFAHLSISPGEGIGGAVFSGGKAYVIQEFAADEHVLVMDRNLIPSGWGGVCIPIKTAVETIGLFYLSVPSPRRFTPEEVRLLDTLAEIAGNAIHRMRLYERTEQNVKRLNSLRTVDLTITASLDLRITLDILLEQVINQLHADAADVLLFRESSHELEYLAGRGWRGSHYRRTHLGISTGFAGKVLAERKVLQVSNLTQVDQGYSENLFLKEEGFETYFGIPLIAKGRVKGVLEIFHRTSFVPDTDWLDFFETLADQAAIAIEDTQLFDHLQKSNAELTVAYDSTIEGWSRALELRDRETEGHTRRVTEMTLELARLMGIDDEEQLVYIRRGALLHDIGKMGVPDRILFKRSALTDAEWLEMKKHPSYAYEMLSKISYLRPALTIPLYHHEKWDGTGYPKGLKGAEIPFEARIFAVVDVWDALTSTRSYRKAWSVEKVRAYIIEQAGIHFDPRVVEGFFKLLDRVLLKEDQ